MKQSHVVILPVKRIVAAVILIAVVGSLVFFLSDLLMVSDFKRNATMEKARVDASLPSMKAYNMEQPVFDGMLPEKYLEGVELMAMSYENSVFSVEDFFEWRDEVNRSQVEYYGVNQPQYKLETPIVYDQLVLDSYTITKYTIPAIDGEDILFYELKPHEEREKYPTVIMMPGTGNQGARDLIGLDSEIVLHYYHDRMAARLAEAGFLVFVPEQRFEGEREVYMDICDVQSNSAADRVTGCSTRVIGNQLDMIGVNYQQLQMQDDVTLYKYILSLDYVGKIGVGGLSVGSGFSETFARANDVDAVALVSGTGSILHAPPATSTRGSDRLLGYDSNDGAAALAPTPLYISFGKGETGILGWEAETGHTAKKISGIYEMLGVPNDFTYHVHNGGHAYHPESLIDFFERHLK